MHIKVNYFRRKLRKLNVCKKFVLFLLFFLVAFIVPITVAVEGTRGAATWLKQTADVATTGRAPRLTRGAAAAPPPH